MDRFFLSSLEIKPATSSQAHCNLELQLQVTGPLSHLGHQHYIKMTKFIVFLGLFLVYLASQSFAEEEGEFRGLRIGIVKKPKRCPQETKHGDHLNVKYNCSMVDGTLLVPQR